MQGNIILFEDHYMSDMWPVTLTRPAFAVSGAAGYNLRDVAHMVSDRVACLVRDYLKEISQRRYPCAERGKGPTLFINASLAPDVRYVERLKAILQDGAPFLCTSDQRVAVALVSEDTPLPEDLSPESVASWLLERNLPLRTEAFKTQDYPFHLVGMLQDLFPANLTHRIETGDYTRIREGVYVGKDVKIAETAVFHAEDGPIVLEDGVQVMDFAYIVGPVYMGPKSRVIERASLKDFVSVSHTCKIGGEVEASIIEAYTNKQHHGFLGHAYVGSWVNLGAGTSNSDLKNTYGKVRIEHNGRKLDTGMQFFGCVIGDFAKSAINTSIFTGKIIGVNSMMYGYVGQNVPSFCNYAKSFGQITEVPIDTAVSTQKRMFSRRKVDQTPEDAAVLEAAYNLTREERSLSSELPVL